jgi:hypothetical protein
MVLCCIFSLDEAHTIPLCSSVVLLMFISAVHSVAHLIDHAYNALPMNFLLV